MALIEGKMPITDLLYGILLAIDGPNRGGTDPGRIGSLKHLYQQHHKMTVNLKHKTHII